MTTRLFKVEPRVARGNELRHVLYTSSKGLAKDLIYAFRDVPGSPYGTCVRRGPDHGLGETGFSRYVEGFTCFYDPGHSVYLALCRLAGPLWWARDEPRVGSVLYPGPIREWPDDQQVAGRHLIRRGGGAEDGNDDDVVRAVLVARVAMEDRSMDRAVAATMRVVGFWPVRNNSRR